MKQDDRITFSSTFDLRTWNTPSSMPTVELQHRITTGPGQEPTPLPWVRMTLSQAAELVDLLARQIAAAQGVVEPPDGPLQ
jgi:hypothetical protein